MRFFETLTDRAVTALVVLAVTLAFNTSISYFTEDKGAVLVGPVVTLAGESYATLDVSNYSNTPLDGLLLSVPSAMDTAEIVSSNPVQVSEVADITAPLGVSRLRVSGIEPSRVTRLLIPLGSQAGEPVRPVNARALRLSVSSADDVHRPIARVVREALVSSIATAGSLLVFLWWSDKQMKEVDQRSAGRIANLNKDSKELHELNEAIKAQMASVRKEIQRVRLALLARLSDYSKELDFWRDTVRKILYQATQERTTAETVIEQVTDSLKTYGTRAREFDWEATKVLAAMLSTQIPGEETTAKPGPTASAIKE